MRLSKKLAALAVAGGIALSATAAYAFWTTGGLGSGSGTVGSSNGSVSLTGSVAPGLYPGGSVVVSFKASNSGDQAVGVGTIQSVITTTPEACAADLHLADVPSGQNIAAHASDVDLTATGSLTMDNTSANQDACKNASISLALSSSAG